MKKASYKIVFNRLKKLNRDGTGLVQIECYLEGKRKYVSTGIKIKPDYWDQKNGRVKNNHEQFIQLNRLLDQQLKKIEDIEFRVLEKNGNFTLDMIDEVNRIHDNDFIKFCHQMIESNTGAKEGTRKQHTVLVHRLERFKKKITFDDISFAFVKSFDHFLQNETLKINTIANMHKILKTFINLAINHGLIPLDRYPYKTFKLKREKTNRPFLTLSEIEKIEHIVFPKDMEQVESVRDMFVFSCYTGLRFSDVQNLTNKDILKSQGEYSIQIRQQKTGEFINLPISLMFKGKSVDIIQKNESDSPEKFIFRRISNQHANLKLKIISVISGINKNLTFHLARHSFGTNLASATSDGFLIRNLMGHSDIRTSMIYIHTSQEQIKTKLKNTDWGKH
jgi:integrase